MVELILTDTTKQTELVVGPTLDNFMDLWNQAAADWITQNDEAAIYMDAGSGYYTYMRVAELFDGSQLPQNAVIDSVVLRIFVEFFDNLTSSHVKVLKAQENKPSNPVVESDYNNDNWDGEIGSIPLASLIPEQYNDIPITIFTSIVTGWIGLYLVLANDASGTEQPDGTHDSVYFSALFVDRGMPTQNPPMLVINYHLDSPSSSPPTNSNIMSTLIRRK